jgi:hypothetical protein
MPPKSKKKQKISGIIRKIQKNNELYNAHKTVKCVKYKITEQNVNDYIRTYSKGKSTIINLIHEAVNEMLTESDYKFSKIKEIPLDDKKGFKEILAENKGVKFGISELLIFQERQNEFGGSGKVTFVLNLNKNEILTKLTINNITKKYVFKKLPNVEYKGNFNYAVFIQKMDSENKNENIVYALSQTFNNKDQSTKTKILSDFITRVNTYGI